MSKRALLAVLIAGSVAFPAAAQPAPQPPPPKEYDVLLRYRIQAGRNDRLRQFFALVKYLEDAGFHKEPGPFDEPENPTYDRMAGKVASNRVRELLQASAVKTVLLAPAGYELPAEPDTPVKVRLELSAGRPAEQQRIFADQVRAQLRELGFSEPLVYDHRGHSRLVGYLPAGSVLELLKDLRYQPAGWLTAARPIRELPLPLRDVSTAIRIAEIAPEPEGVDAAKAFPPPEPLKMQDPQIKLVPELRALIGKEEKPQRVEIILLGIPGVDEVPWHTVLRRVAPGIVIEGQFGRVVTALVTPDDAGRLTGSPLVAAVRLPRPAVSVEPPSTNAKDVNAAVLTTTGLERLHDQGFRGQGTKVAVIGADFRGFEALRGKQLPKATRLLDLTAERDFYLRPEPAPEGQGLGHGTRCAIAVALAAPEAELVLVRVDPAAYHQMQTIARNVNGEAFYSESMLARRDDLEFERKEIAAEWLVLTKQRRFLFDNMGSADELDDEAVRRAEQRKAHREDVKKLQAREALYHEGLDRFLKLVADLRDLQTTPVIVSTLVWPDGHPVDGSSALSRYLDDRPFRSTWWFQAAGDTRGQAWTGLFRDADGDGVMEFAPAGKALKPERWSPEVNFVAWQPYRGPKVLELPAKARLRVSVQWREAHDPAFSRRSEDPYLLPLADVRLMLLRQRDPTGKKLPADEMEVVARAAGLPLRVNVQDDCATYEQVLEFTVENPGRYALRIEGKAPIGNKPPGAATLPEQQRSGELRPRVYLDVTDTESRASGRPVFQDYASNEGDIAMPADAQRVVSVGASDRYTLARPYSAAGPAANLDLQPKPNLVAPDGLELEPGKAVHGTGVSAAFAGGLAASLLSNGAPPLAVRNALPAPGENLFAVPERWQGYRPTPRK